MCLFIIILIMKYISGIITSDERGSAGGVTFSRNHNSKYVKAKSCPHDSQSLSQLSVRALNAYLSQTWRKLSRSDQSTWNALALLWPQINNLGVTYYLSGFQIYMKLNRILQSVGEAIISTAPDIADNNVAAIDNFYAVCYSNPLMRIIECYYNTPIPADCKMTIDATGWISAGVFSPFTFKRVAVWDDTFASGSELTAYYENIFGKLPYTGSVCFFRAKYVNVNTGFISSYSYFRAVASVLPFSIGSAVIGSSLVIN